jgi:hypothetical protein
VEKNKNKKFSPVYIILRQHLIAWIGAWKISRKPKKSYQVSQFTDDHEFE